VSGFNLFAVLESGQKTVAAGTQVSSMPMNLLKNEISFSTPTAWVVQPSYAPCTSSRLTPRWPKRLLDLTCLLLASPGVLVLMGAVALLIKAVSSGPVFFRQERVGCRRSRFVCWKFRTMKAGAETATHQQHLKALVESDRPMVKMDALGDPRLIPFGRFLRATGLDELPQVINVLRGEMSLVGPRPCTPYELENYRPGQFARFDGLPGLTGLWQVKGKNKTTFSQMIELDIEYVKSRSLWLDLKIMAATLPALVTQVSEVRRRRRDKSSMQMA
jgi:lipopolysaccharide/colanic/teichoic acid biosynthesis glycosyltransferase